MRRILLLAVTLAVMPAIGFCSTQAVQDAKKRFNNHQYESALRVLLPHVKEANDQSRFTLATILVKNAELYKALYDVSLPSQVEYLGHLVKPKKGKAPNRYADLFLAEAYMEQGRLKKASSHLDKFLKQKKIEKNYRDIALVKKGTVLWRQKEKTKAKEVWAKLAKSKNGLVLSEMAVVQALYMKDMKQASTLLDQAIKQVKSISDMPVRMLSNAVVVFDHKGTYTEAMALTEEADMGAWSFQEDTIKDKVVKYYDVALLGRMAEVYRAAANSHLDALAANPKYQYMVALQKIDLSLMFGDKKAAVKAVTALSATGGLPDKMAPLLKVRSVIRDYEKGNQKKAIASWRGGVAENARNPVLASQILITCVRLQAKCRPVADEMEKVADKMRGPSAVVMNHAIGHFYMAKGDYGKALDFFELARNKSLKNKIEANDPLLLVALSEAYRRSKQYSEHLEIYFEMSKEFPGVRQIQEAVQGIYAMQQRSAGDVKIF